MTTTESGSVGSTGRPVPAEVRYGLVLYGGVSLAIYIYGVCLELLDIVRASNEPPGGQHRKDSPYNQLLNDLDARVVVDIIAGTSAGGINGAALAAALRYNGFEGFKQLRETWIDKVSIQNLLNDDSGKARKKDPAHSLLSGKKFAELLQEGFQKIVGNRPDDPMVDEIELFVHATDLTGRARQIPLFNNTSVATSTHRHVFHKRYRKGSQNDLDFDTQPELWEICRATASFPFVFEPVSIDIGTPRTGQPDLHWFADGGVLNNKPFDQVIDAITLRPASTLVDRALIYVEPDPNATAMALKYPAEHVNHQMPSPHVDEVVIDALVGLPRKDPIFNDLDRLNRMNQRVAGNRKRRELALERFKEFCESDQYWRQPPSDVVASNVVSETDASHWLGGERHGLERFRNSAFGSAYTAWKVSQLRTELTSAVTALEPEIGPQRIDRVIGLLAEGDDEEQQGTRYRNFLKQFDISFKIRRLHYLAYEAIDEIHGPGSQTDAELRALVNAKAGYLRTAREINELGREIAGIIAVILKNGRDRELSDLVDEIDEAVEELWRAPGQDDGAETNRDVFRSTALKTSITLDNELRRKGADVESSFVARAASYEIIDAFLYPYIAQHGLGERDPVETIRISPRDAKWMIDRASKIDPEFAEELRKTTPEQIKLSGETLGHFGGFLRADWRGNDIMWGRLDAAEMLVRHLHRVIPDSDTKPSVEHYLEPILESIAKEEVLKLRELKNNDSKEFSPDFVRDVLEVSTGRATVGEQEPEQAFNLGGRSLGVLQRVFATLATQKSESNEGGFIKRLVLPNIYRGIARVLDWVNSKIVSVARFILNKPAWLIALALIAGPIALGVLDLIGENELQLSDEVRAAAALAAGIAGVLVKLFTRTLKSATWVLIVFFLAILVFTVAGIGSVEGWLNDRSDIL